MNKARNYVEIYRKFLQDKKMNVTPERFEILDIILKFEGHFKIDDVLTASGNSVSQATLYRTIKTIEDAGIIKSIRFQQDEKVYEVSQQHHDHMICTVCGDIIEFYDKDLEELQNAICERHGFTPKNHIMKIFGVCEKCRDC